MRRVSLIWLAGLLTLATSGLAQFDIQVRMDRDTYLLYEAVPVSVAIRNYSGRLVTVNTHEESWLEFLITDEAGSVVRPVKSLRLDEPLVIGPGQTVVQTFDILPAYELRQRGTYRLRARMNQAGQVRLSSPVPFTILQGREIWHQIAGLPPGPDGRDEYRLYSLVARQAPDGVMLYVGVQDQEKQLVYGMLPLGVLVPVDEPQAQIDKDGRLHVLFQTRPRLFGYVCVDGQAKIVETAIYSDLLSKPQLAVSAERTVSVVGGEKTSPRDASRIQEAPAPSSPPPPPKKKWWWPFGPHDPSPAH